MATTNPAYVVASSLEQIFIDKDTGAPLSQGLVYFYVDSARSTLKPVYEQVDTPIPYSYVPLPNPVVLSIWGTFQDASGNNILPYYYPFDAQGNEQLYFIEVYSSLDGVTPAVLQFTREGWPPAGFLPPSSNTETGTFNYIPNGQFIAHNNIAATSTTAQGLITQPVTIVAQGGWTFERPTGSSATDTVLFTRYSTPITSPPGNPRYAINIVNTVPSSADAYKRLCIAFKDVNKFSSATQNYTFSFQAIAASGIVEINLNLIKNFGNGGTPTTPPVIVPIGSPVMVSSVQGGYPTTFNFPLNTGYSIGINDDDTVQIALYFPTSETFNVTLTDFLLEIGEVTQPNFPDETDNDMITRSSTWLPIPDPNGYSLYLPLVYTQSGAMFDYNVVGRIVTQTSVNAFGNILPFNGATYISANYSPLGIPYARLLNFLLLNSPLQFIPMYGTGLNYATAFAVTGQPTEFNLVINTAGGATPPTVGTSGFTLTGSDPSYTFTIPARPAASTYFTFTTNPSAPRNFFVWYQVGSSTIPSVSGTGIKVTLTGTETPSTVVGLTQSALNAYQYLIPNLAGYFLRGLDTTGAVDPDFATRAISELRLTGAFLGSFEVDAFRSHNHLNTNNGQPTLTLGGGVDGSSTGEDFGTNNLTSSTGGSETRPVNFAVNYYIIY